MQREPQQAPAAASGVEETVPPWQRPIVHFAERVRALSAWRQLAAALAAGAVSVLSMPPFFAWPVLLLTLPMLVWLVDGAERAASASKNSGTWRALLGPALIGWCFGYAFHVAGLYWIREAFLVTGGRLAWLWPLGVLGLPIYLAVYHALAAIIAVWLGRPGLSRVAALALGLGVSEWLRGHLFTGFPWNVLGEALTYPVVLMQSVSVLGIYGLTILTVMVLASPLVMLAEPCTRATQTPARPWLWAAASLIVPLAVMVTFGALRLSATPPPDVPGVKLRLVQPSLDQHEKWLLAKQPEFIARQIALSLTNPEGQQDNLAGITHVIWPEAAMPFLPLNRPEVMKTIADAVPSGVHLIAGILRLEPGETRDQDKIYNSLAVLDDDARLVAIYDKTHLVPFGEYLPFQSLLESIGLSALTRQRGGFALGATPRPVLDIPGLQGIGPLICYEAVFPGVSKSSTTRPRVLMNLTNDGWFGNSTGPRQHLHQARLRAVEEGIPLIRVANNGITAAFDAYGRERARLDLNAVGVIDMTLPAPIGAPIYGRIGDLIFCVLVLLVIFLLMVARRKINNLNSNCVRD